MPCKWSILSQALVLYGLSVPDPLAAGVLHTTAALLHPSLDIFAELSLLASDFFPSFLPLSFVLCSVCALRFARDDFAEALNSTADGVWTLATMFDNDDVPRYCWLVLALTALYLLVDEI